MTEDKIPASLYWYKYLITVMSRLPAPEDAHWTKSERGRWLAALQAMLDLLIAIDEG